MEFQRRVAVQPVQPVWKQEEETTKRYDTIVSAITVDGILVNLQVERQFAVGIIQ